MLAKFVVSLGRVFSIQTEKQYDSAEWWHDGTFSSLVPATIQSSKVLECTVLWGCWQGNGRTLVTLHHLKGRGEEAEDGCRWYEAFRGRALLGWGFLWFVFVYPCLSTRTKWSPLKFLLFYKSRNVLHQEHVSVKWNQGEALKDYSPERDFHHALKMDIHLHTSKAWKRLWHTLYDQNTIKAETTSCHCLEARYCLYWRV